MRPETSRRRELYQGVTTHRVPRARFASMLRPGCEELRRLAKGCPAPKQTSGQPPITHGRVPNPKEKKCSLGLQVTVEGEAGLFWQQRRKQLWPLSHRKQPPVLVAQGPRRSRGAAQPAADRQRLGTARSVSSPPVEGGPPREAKKTLT